ncbi:MAG TPA: YlcI/YnfO family protein [Acidimicrobiales bacterium]|nr:YlcI/YnfO family protein [Acidimicrobiales bacterium]
MGRPRLYDEPRITTAVRFPLSLRAELVEAAAARDVSINFLVLQAVRDYLRRLPSLEGEQRPGTIDVGAEP